MNKKGSVVIYGLMVGLTIIILALALAEPVYSFINTSMNATSGDKVGLDCNNESISNFDKATCVVVDLNGFYFIGALILIGGAFFTYKIVLN